MSLREPIGLSSIAFTFYRDRNRMTSVKPYFIYQKNRPNMALRLHMWASAISDGKFDHVDRAKLFVSATGTARTDGGEVERN